MSTTAVHVYQPGNIPMYSENTQQAEYVAYCRTYNGRVFRDVFVHDEPVDEQQKQWLEQEIYSRLQKGGVIRILPSPSPVSKPSPWGSLGPAHPDHPDHVHEDCCK